MSIIRVGSTGKYADGWELAFGKKSRKSPTTKKTARAKKSATAKKSRKK